MKKTSARLADGREILYFDETEDAERVLVDPRELPPVSTSSEMRFDPVLEEWVAIASHRQSRTHLPASDQCPLCPSRDGRQTEIPSPDYDVVVFENRFPSFGAPYDAPPLEDVAGIVPRRPAVGRCDVVCFTPDHDASFTSLPPERVRTVIEAWADRTVALAEVPGVEQVFCFENRGQEIGVTLHHPHGQVYGYPFVTPRTRRMLDAARRHRERTWRNLFADLLAAEREDGERVVVSTEHWTAFVPAAARWPVEVHLYPHRQVPDLPALTGEERDDLAVAYLEVLRRMAGLYGEPMPYIAAWHQAPARIDRDLAHLHLQVTSPRRAPGKLKHLAGSESAMWAFVSDVAPEAAAAALRGVAL